MAILAVKMDIPHATSVKVEVDTLTVELDDGRTVSVPVAWYPRLLHASEQERMNWRLIGKGRGIHWEAVDEDISVEGILAGRPSGESQASLKKWLESERLEPNESAMAEAFRRLLCCMWRVGLKNK